MSRREADLPGRDSLSEQDLVIAGLVGRYIERREQDHGPCADDLLAVAGEHGDTAVDALRTLLPAKSGCAPATRTSADGRPATRWSQALTGVPDGREAARQPGGPQ
jgi:hypothetical protein